MHDTAYRLGGMVISTYAQKAAPRILEIGSLDVNGTLREHAPEDAEYVGLDFDEGPGVDIVVKADEPLPVPDGYFDLVIASSVFEHDHAYWNTFLEMCRKVAPGGYLYVSAPSNGTVHRYPQDCWRFYPDAGLALVRWSRRQAFDVTLVESFTADRDNDVWNDFCAIFRQGPVNGKEAESFISERISCRNIFTCRSNELISPSDETQDMIILGEQRAEIKRLNDLVAQTHRTLAAEVEKWNSERERLQREAEEAVDRKQLEAALEARDASVEAEALLREEVATLSRSNRDLKVELEQLKENALVLNHALEAAGSEEAHLQALLQASETRITEGEHVMRTLEEQVRSLQGALMVANETIGRLQEDLHAGEQDTGPAEPQAADSVELEELRRKLAEQRLLIAELQDQRNENVTFRSALADMDASIHEISEKARVAEEELQRRFSELAKMTTALLELEDRLNAREEELQWLREVSRVLLDNSKLWSGLMPVRMMYRRTMRHLASQGLFDSEAYAKQYPDVIAAGQTPLRHFVVHGLDEFHSATR